MRKFAFDQNFEWKFEGQYIYFNYKKKDENPLNSDFLIQKSLKYVGDLDSIIWYKYKINELKYGDWTSSKLFLSDFVFIELSFGITNSKS